MKLIAASSLAVVAAATSLATVTVADDDFDSSASAQAYEAPEASGYAHLSTFQDGKLWELSTSEKYSSQQVSIKEAIHAPPGFLEDKVGLEKRHFCREKVLEVFVEAGAETEVGTHTLESMIEAVYVCARVP